MVIDGLFSQTRGRLQVWGAEDFHYLLEVQRDMVVQKPGSHHSHAGACVAIKQRPVIQGQALGAVLDAEKG